MAATEAVPESAVSTERFRVQEAFSGTLQSCLAAVPETCKVGTPARRTMRITNIRFAWANDGARRANFLAAVRGDIAAAAGVSRDAVTITGIREGSVIVDFEIQGSSASETDDAVAVLDAQLASGAVPLLTTEQLAGADAASAKVDTSLALGTDTGAGGDTTGASAPAATALATALTVMLLAAAGVQ